MAGVTTPLLPDDPDTKKSGLEDATQWWNEFTQKWKGQGDQPPSPSWDWRVAAVTFFGVALSLTLISYLAALFGSWSGHSGHHELSWTSEHWVLLLGSYGALATLLFAAPQAPVSQPRMVLGGHAIAILVAIAFDRISEPAYGTAILPREMAVGLAPAVAITAMQILGLTHPPAGAAVLVFLFYPESIRQMGLLFYVPVYLGCFILVLMALVINNAFSFRPAYPRFW